MQSNWVRVLFRPDQRLFAREINDIQKILRQQQARVFGKLLGRFRILSGLKLQRISPTQFLLTRGVAWVILDGEGHFVRVPEQLVYDSDQSIGLVFERESLPVDENVRVPNIFFSSAIRQVIRPVVAFGRTDSFPLDRPAEHIPPNRLGEISSSFIAHGLHVRDRGDRIELTPGAAWVNGRRATFHLSTFLPKQEGNILLSSAGRFRIAETQRPDEMILGEWRGGYSEFSIRAVTIETVFEAVESLRELRREISGILLARGASTRLTRSGDPLDSDSTSPLFSAVWDLERAFMRSGLRAEPFYFGAASNLEIQGVTTGEWWHPRVIETDAELPEPTRAITIDANLSPRIDLSSSLLFEEIPAESALEYASLTVTGRRVTITGSGFVPGEFEVLVGGIRLTDFNSDQRGPEGGIVPEPNGTFSLSFVVDPSQINHVISVGPATAVIAEGANSSQVAGSVALVFDSPGRTVCGVQLLFRRGPASATLALTRVVDGAVAEPLAFATLTNIQSSPAGQSPSRALFDRPVWLAPGQYAFVLSTTTGAEIFASVTGEAALGTNRPALNTQYTGRQWRDVWAIGPTPCMAPIWCRPVELRNQIEFELDSERALVSMLPVLKRFCPAGTSVNFFVQQGGQFVGLEKMQLTNAARRNRFRVEFLSAPQAVPLLRAADSAILGFSHRRVSYWVSRSQEVDLYNHIEVDAWPSTPGITEFLVAVSANDGQTWEELNRVDEHHWERSLSPTARRVRADGTTFEELRRSMKLRFEMRVNPDENEFVSFVRYSVRTSQR